MPPHGPGQIGASHSHSIEYPDDEWNLYQMLDASTTALNVTVPQDAISIFKPHALKLTAEPCLISAADAEIIIIARFTSPVQIRKLMVIGNGDEMFHPAILRCYVNIENIDFGNVMEMNAAQVFPLVTNFEGGVELMTDLRVFKNITTLTFYFVMNHGEQDITRIQYIGMQGEHTHYKREAVDAVYEVLCNGQDLSNSSDVGAHEHQHDHIHDGQHGHSHDHHH